jgi:hypothetical protein
VLLHLTGCASWVRRCVKREGGGGEGGGRAREMEGGESLQMAWGGASDAEKQVDQQGSALLLSCARSCVRRQDARGKAP